MTVTIATLAERLEPGRLAFNHREFFDAHERWEEVWRGLEGEERLLVQGLIQIAAGLHHLQRGRSRPAARLVAKGVEKISRCAPRLRREVRVAPLVQAAARLSAKRE